MFYSRFYLVAFFIMLMLSACAYDNRHKVEVGELGAGVKHDQHFDLFGQGQGIHSPWQVSLFNSQEHMQLQGEQTELSDASVRLKRLSNTPRGEALLLNFKDYWFSGLFFADSTLDLSVYSQEGIVEFDLRIDAIDKGSIDLVVGCEENCPRAYRLREWAQANQQKGWQHLAIPLRCLVDVNSDLTKVERPFTLSTGGDGQVALANVVFRSHGKGNMPCHSRIEIATTPAISNEYWTTDWWMPRHKEKLIQANEGKAELIMIGDSITHFWESDEKDVWNKYFADIDTLNLGFGGDRTENVLWRLQHGELGKTKAKLIVVMIGTNNTGLRMDPPEAIIAGVTKIVDQLQIQAPQAKILLLEIFPRDARADSVLRNNNKIASDLIEALAKERGLLFANFNAKFLTDDGTLTTEMMPDLLHPKALGYEVWAKQLKPFVDQYVRQKSSNYGE